MKKFIYITSVVFFLACVFASCTSHERCPAYGDVQPIEQQSDKA